MTVALTAYVAARSVVQWQEQRERDRETTEYKHRQEVYEAIGTYMLNRLTAQPTDVVLDAQLRTRPPYGVVQKQSQHSRTGSSCWAPSL